MRIRQLRRKLIWFSLGLYVFLILFAVLNTGSNVITEEITQISIHTENLTLRPTCHADVSQLTHQEINLFARVKEADIEKNNDEIAAGGAWKPPKCNSQQRLGVLIPYRGRWNHLLLLLQRLHQLLQKQLLQYRIYVIEQKGTAAFNRGRLLNVGVLESLRIDPLIDCFVFHDVDLLPEHDANLYLCNQNARHLAAAIDEMRYHVMYYNYAGGVLAMSRENVFRVNGYSNDYWGWGSEDDDFCARFTASGLYLSRPPMKIAQYKMVRHKKSWRPETNGGYDMFMTWRSRWKRDGLSSLDRSKYTVTNTTDHRLYTHLLADLGPPPVRPVIDPAVPKESTYWFLSFFFP